jgi:hypothetical protein
MQNLISDWANFLMFITVFIFGFIIASDEKFGEAIDRHWKAGLVIGLIIAVTLSLINVVPLQTGLNQASAYVIKMILRGMCIWFCLIGFLGFGKRFLNREGILINYAREAALPVYILHLPMVVVIGFYVIKFDFPIWSQYFVITIISLISSVLLYEIGVRRINFFKFFLGLKKRVQVSWKKPKDWIFNGEQICGKS